MKERKRTTKVIVHCAATPNGKDFSVETIRGWHLKRGWSDIGYHFVIAVDGKVETGRDINLQGAHTLGENDQSIGICMVGTDKFSDKQWQSLVMLIRSLRMRYQLLDERIYGHYEYANKDCPGFDMVMFNALLAMVPEK